MMLLAISNRSLMSDCLFTGTNCQAQYLDFNIKHTKYVGNKLLLVVSYSKGGYRLEKQITICSLKADIEMSDAV